MRLRSQDEILNQDVRKQIISEIEMPENQRRKDEAYKRYQLYKDHTDRFVVDQLLRQFSASTVEEMSYAISNVSLVRKVIDKLARVYAPGTNRKVMIDGKENEEATADLQDLEKKLEFNSRMKQTNRFLKLNRNVAHYVKPCPFIDDDGNEKHRVVLSPLLPYLYDVVEEFYDRAKPLVYILSDYEQKSLTSSVIDPANHLNLKAHASAHINLNNQHLSIGNKQDEKIADKKEDEETNSKTKTYIWWTNKYHFTTDETGAVINSDGDAIINPDDDEISNPIEMMPMVNFAIDQDGSFWAEGGDDLISSGIKINSMITNMDHIGVTQGYGQFWMSGKDLPANIETGPSKYIKLEVEEGEAQPQVGFATANPPLAELRGQVEMSVALTLTTNNLSTSGVSTQLGSSAGFANGISLMIDKSESVEDVMDQRQIFTDKEQSIWDRISAWIGVFTLDGTIDPDLEGLALPENSEVSTEFMDPPAISSESEKLDNIGKRKDLGLNTMEDLIKKDQPGLNDEQVKEKLAKIEEEKKERMESFAPMPGADEDDEEEDDSDGKDNKNNFDSKESKQ